MFVMAFLIKQLQEFPSDQVLWIQIGYWLFVGSAIGILIYFLLSVLLLPIMYVYNLLTDRNKSNVLSESDYLIGELTTRIKGNSVGEVLEVGSGTALSMYPAKLYREQDRLEQLELPKGTQVLIIGFDTQGIALVVKNKKLGVKEK